MKYRIVEQPAFEAVGWMHRARTVDGENLTSIPKFWADCHAQGKVAAIAPLRGPLGLLGVCAEMDYKQEEFTYLIGVVKVAGKTYPEGTLSPR